MLSNNQEVGNPPTTPPLSLGQDGDTQGSGVRWVQAPRANSHPVVQISVFVRRLRPPEPPLANPPPPPPPLLTHAGVGGWGGGSSHRSAPTGSDRLLFFLLTLCRRVSPPHVGEAGVGVPLPHLLPCPSPPAPLKAVIFVAGLVRSLFPPRRISASAGQVASG